MKGASTDCHLKELHDVSQSHGQEIVTYLFQPSLELHPISASEYKKLQVCVQPPPHLGYPEPIDTSSKEHKRAL